MSIWKDAALWDTKDVPMCFGCGRDNTIGLKLDFHQEGESVRAEFIPGEMYQGWPGVVHGGLICTMLDEVIGYVVTRACMLLRSRWRCATENLP